jgi:crotonobetainyl-CoA:carnitine CoA-transferase CaiB-like acyl-CoA transferase
VSTSLLRTGLYCVGWDTGIRLRFGTVAPTAPRTQPLNPVLNQYRSRDARWFWLLGLEAERHWPKLARVIERPELIADERFADARAATRLGGAHGAARRRVRDARSRGLGRALRSRGSLVGARADPGRGGE